MRRAMGSELGARVFAALGEAEARKRIAVCLFFLALFAAHLPLLRPVLQNGDSAVYNQQIDDRDLTNRTTHVGYIALGIVFNRLLPFSTDLNMNVMVLLVGVLGLAGVYSIAKAWSESRLAALSTVPLALGLPSQVEGMLLSEVDCVSVAFVALAFACFQRGAAFPAGLLFGFSLLVTPLSGPLVVLFVMTTAVRTLAERGALLQPLRRLLKFGGGSLFVYVPTVLVLYRDYVHGPRGLLHAPRENFTVPKRIATSWEFIVDELDYTLPLYVIAAIICLASRRMWRAGQPALALFVSVAVMAVVGQRFVDVPVQLPNLVLFGVLPALAFAVSRPALRVALAVLFCACFFNVRSSYARVLADVRSRERDRNVCLAIKAQSEKAPLLVGVSGWSQSRMFERYASSPELRAKALTWQAFVRNQKHWLAPANRAPIWFFRKVNSGEIGRLLEHYSLESRTVANRKLKVLVPKPD